MESGEDKIMPKLTLMEEVLLLGLKDKQVSLLRSLLVLQQLQTSTETGSRIPLHDAQPSLPSQMLDQGPRKGYSSASTGDQVTIYRLGPFPS